MPSPLAWTTNYPFDNTRPLWAEVAARYGWRSSPGVLTCPIVVRKRACSGSNWGGRPCICHELANQLPGESSTSARRRWVDHDGARVVTWATGLSAEGIATFRAICADRGVSVEVADRPYTLAEGMTLLVIRAAR
jgi:hypothetical protein